MYTLNLDTNLINIFDAQRDLLANEDANNKPETHSLIDDKSSLRDQHIRTDLQTYE